jgi:Protein of unknown function with PCYCGC motif
MSESKKRKLDPAVIVVIVIVAASAVYGGVSVYRSRAADSASRQTAAAGDAAQHLRMTLDPEQFVGEVKKAYQIAEHDPALLAQMHCYCGCDRTDGHKNLLDCYRDTHGAHCAICTGEAIEAEKLASQGMPVEKIRDALRDRFGNGE